MQLSHRHVAGAPSVLVQGKRLRQGRVFPWPKEGVSVFQVPQIGQHKQQNQLVPEPRSPKSRSWQDHTAPDASGEHPFAPLSPWKPSFPRPVAGKHLCLPVPTGPWASPGASPQACSPWVPPLRSWPSGLDGWDLVCMAHTCDDSVSKEGRILRPGY